MLCLQQCMLRPALGCERAFRLVCSRTLRGATYVRCYLCDHLWDPKISYIGLAAHAGNMAAPAPADSAPATNGAAAPAGTYLCYV